MAELLSAIHHVLDAEEDAITIRHLFYRLLGLDVIPKTEPAYKSLASIFHAGANLVRCLGTLFPIQLVGISKLRCLTASLTLSRARETRTGAICGRHNLRTSKSGLRRMRSPE